MGLASFNRMRALQAEQAAKEAEKEVVAEETKKPRTRNTSKQKEGETDAQADE